MATTQKDIIQAFMKSLDNTTESGTAAIDEAVKACSNFDSAQAVVDQMVKDCRNAKSVTDFLEEKCGIILDNADTGAVTGSDMGGSTVKTAESIVPESGGIKSFSKNYFTKNGVRFELGTINTANAKYHYVNKDFSSLTDKQKFMWRGLYTWWASASLDLIESSYGSNFGFGSDSEATVNTIHTGFVNKRNNVLATTSYWFNTETGISEDLDLTINMYYYNNVNTSDPNGSTSSTGATYLDRTLAHEFTHAVMAANINNYYTLPRTITEGMAELTQGIDDDRRDDIKTLAGDSSLLKQSLQFSTDYNSVSGVNSPDYAGGYMFLHYLAKQSATEKITSRAGNYISNSNKDTIISGTAYNDTIYNDSGNYSTISAGAGDDSISGRNNYYVTVQAASGNDTIGGFFWDSKIDGGTGADFISVRGGVHNKTSFSNTINGGAGKDTIYAVGGKYINGGTGNDYISVISTYSAPATLLGGSGKDTIRGGNGKDSISGGNGNDYLDGGKSSDYISGGAGNDTIYGGAGSDTLYGGAGKDVFVYANSTGKDIITDYTEEADKIYLTSGSVKKVSYSGKNVVFAVGSGSITVKNGAGKNITVEDSDGSTVYNAQTAGKITSSSSKAFAEYSSSLIDEEVELTGPGEWIYITHDITIDSLGEIFASTQNFDTLTQENLITYAK